MLCVKAQLEETLSLRGKLNPIGSQLVVQFRLADGVVNLLFDILVKATVKFARSSVADVLTEFNVDACSYLSCLGEEVGGFKALISPR